METMARDQLDLALASSEAEVEAAVKAAQTAFTAAKKLRTAARNGNVRELPRAMEAVDQAISSLRQRFEAARESWAFDSEAYLANGDYQRELLETASRMGLRIFEQDDRLFCYPFLLRVLPGERTVLIDKLRERRLRPAVLVRHLKFLQSKPVRFKPEAFLESLYAAYRALAGHDQGSSGPVLKLHDLYDLLTLLPGASKDYSRQEFARDIYLLDQSRVTQTKDGHVACFPASTATRASRQTIALVTQEGHEKKYYGISFARP